MTKEKGSFENISRKFSFFLFASVWLVVIYHSNFRYYCNFIDVVGPAVISSFFYVSSFFFYRGITAENVMPRLKKRLQSVLLPYFLWNLIYMLLYCKQYEYNVVSVIRGFTVNPYCTPSWYLLTLFLYFLPAPLIRKALTKKWSTIVVLVLGGLTSYLGYVHFQKELALIPVVGGYLIRMAGYVGPFLLGAVIGSRHDDKLHVDWKRSVVALLTAVIMVYLIFHGIPAGWKYLLNILLPLVLWEAVPESLFTHMHFLKWFTDPILFINMSHWYVLFVLQTWAMKMNLGAGFVIFGCIVVAAFICCYALYYLMRWLLPGILGVLTGGRIKK